MATFDFQKQLKFGKDSESIFKLKFPELEKLDGKGPDFKFNDLFIELKTDSYDPTKTGNFFMERYSSMEKQSPGGCWQALQKGSHLFVYYFVKTNSLYVFDTAKLVDHLNKNTFESREIKNRGWTTLGYLVKIDSLAHLYKKYDMSDDLKVDIFTL